MKNLLLSTAMAVIFTALISLCMYVKSGEVSEVGAFIIFLCAFFYFIISSVSLTTQKPSKKSW